MRTARGSTSLLYHATHMTDTAQTAAPAATKVVHTVVRASLAGCIVAIPVASWRSRHRGAVRPAAVVLAEVAVLEVVAVDGRRCPLTAVAARDTPGRRDTFDISLPLWLARYTRQVVGALHVRAAAVGS